jgi:hypothetical protein
VQIQYTLLYGYPNAMGANPQLFYGEAGKLGGGGEDDDQKEISLL